MIFEHHQYMLFEHHLYYTTSTSNTPVLLHCSANCGTTSNYSLMALILQVVRLSRQDRGNAGVPPEQGRRPVRTQKVAPAPASGDTDLLVCLCVRARAIENYFTSPTPSGPRSSSTTPR